MNDIFLLQSLALDLKRSALGYHTNSLKMADRFLSEALSHLIKINKSSISIPIRHILSKTEELPTELNYQKRAEYALTYSTILLSFLS